jgi:hypothetical protein
MPQITIEEITEESLVALRAAVDEYQHIDVKLVIVLTRAIGAIEGLQTLLAMDEKEIADLTEQLATSKNVEQVDKESNKGKR